MGYKNWTKEELHILEVAYLQGWKPKVIARLFLPERTFHAIRGKVRQQGLAKKSNPALRDHLKKVNELSLLRFRNMK